MRIYLFYLLTVLVLSACGDKKADFEKRIVAGKILVENNDCKTCHHPTNKIIGPAHLDVAKKYATTDENIKMLADRIIKGGSGTWGGDTNERAYGPFTGRR